MKCQHKLSSWVAVHIRPPNELSILSTSFVQVQNIRVDKDEAGDKRECLHGILDGVVVASELSFMKMFQINNSTVLLPHTHRLFARLI